MNRTGVAAFLRRPLAAGALLLVCYVGLSFCTDPAGFLGTDTGGKVATVKVMSERGDFDPDVGYWAAQWDPEGRVHGLYYTSHIGDRYLNVTSLPMVLAARPLWDIGGYRAALLLPMLGAIATAFAARALAQRLKGGDGWLAFWVVGLASPVLIYALDLWEHSIGLGLMAWALVALFDAAFDEALWWRGLLAGMAFGAAAAMRTEAFVYVLTSTALACAVIAFGPSRRFVRSVLVGASAVAGFVVVFGANLALEAAVLGEQIRSTRASGAASGGLNTVGVRVKEGLVTFLSPFPDLAPYAWVTGACLLAAIAFASIKATKRSEYRLAVMGLAVAGFIYLWRFSAALGFVPGLVAATPFAAVGIGLGWATTRSRFVLAAGLLPVPVVVAFQFVGGAGPQWAGRYLLLSGFLLAVVGLAESRRMVDWARVSVVVASAAVTLFGFIWLVDRSHEVAEAGRRLEARPEAVLISPNGFIPREFGATYGDKRWLASGSPADLQFAVGVVAASGAPDFGLVDLDTTGEPPTFAGWRAEGSEIVPFLGGTDFRVTTYVRDQG